MSYRELLRQMIAATLVMLLLVGCGAPAAIPVSEAPAATSTQVPSANTPTSEPLTATPTLVPPTATPTPVAPTPTPAPSIPTGTIRGALINAASGEPLSGYLELMLAWEAEQGSSGGEITDIRAPYIDGKVLLPIVVDEKGAFALSNIPPDKYLLILSVGRPDPFNPAKSYLLRDKTGQKLIADLTQGKGIDLGEILVPIR